MLALCALAAVAAGLAPGCTDQVTLDADSVGGDTVSNPDTPGGDSDSGGPLQVIELGALATDAQGISAEVAFEIDSAASAFVIELNADEGVALTIASLRAPDGLTVVPPAWIGLSGSPWLCETPCANRIAARPGQAAFLFPNTPLMTVRPGTWTMRAYAFSATGADPAPVAAPLSARVVVVRTPQGRTPGNALPFNLCLTGAMGINAEIAQAHPRVQAALGEVTATFAQAGLVLAPLRYLDVVDAPQVVASIQGDGNDLHQLFSASEGLPLGVNVFLVERFDVAGAEGHGAGPVLGIAGGIPGPVLQTGGPRTGVAVALALELGQPDRLGRVMAHEVAHYLGLFHSSEAAAVDGSSHHDNLPDTSDDDPDNLMYWKVGSGAGQISADQAAVLAHNPWLLADQMEMEKLSADPIEADSGP